jgi:hypothetical protein
MVIPGKLALASATRTRIPLFVSPLAEGEIQWEVDARFAGMTKGKLEVLCVA